MPDNNPIDPPTAGQAACLLGAAGNHSPELALFVRLALVSGARRGELCALRWPGIDFDRQEMTVMSPNRNALKDRRA